MTEENGKPKYEGELVWLAGREYIVPSLSTKQARTLWPEILKLDEGGVTAKNFPEKFEQIIPIIHAALSRNYPELTVDQVWDMADMRNVRKLLLIVSGRSGLALKEALEKGPEPVADQEVVQ